jgi:type I restriction enzyme S subunit
MLLSNLNLLAQAPGGVARLRELILTLAVQGKLVPQDPSDEPASELLKKIRAEKDRLIAAKALKREKDEPALTDDALPFDVPVTWSWVALGEVIDIVRGITFPATQKTREAAPGRIACLRTSNVQQIIEWDDLLFVDRSFMGREDQLIQHRDIVMSMANSRELVGKVALIDQIPHAEATFGGFLGVLRPRKIDPRYAMAVLRTPYARSLLIDSSSQTTNIANVSLAKLRPLPFPLPPEAEQSRIVTRVEELMRVCDALETKGQLEATQHAQLVSTLLATLTDSETPAQLTENWHRIATHFDLLLDRPEAVDALEQTILQLAVRGLLVPQDPQDEPASELLKKIRAEKDKLIAEGKIKRDKPLSPIAEDEQPFGLPQGWEWCQLDELVTIRGGKRVSNGYQLLTVPTEFIYIRVSDMKNGSIDDSDLRYLDAQMRSAISRYIITKDDIYMTIVGATIGKCGLVPDRFDGMNLTENAARLTPHLVSKDYLFRLLASEFCKEQFLGKTKQVGVQKMALNRLAGTLIPLPPLAEQSRIVTRVAQLRGLCADLRQRLSASQSTQAHLAEALVQEVA